MMQVGLGLVAPFVVVLALSMTVTLLLASLYDVLAAGRLRVVDRAVRSLRRSRQPQVTILVQHNAIGSDKLLRCLRSSSASNYHNLDIVVICPPFARVGRNEARELATGSKHHVRVYNMRTNVPVAICLRRAYKLSRRGEVVLAIDSSTVISPQLVKRAVARMGTGEGERALRLNLRDDRELRLSSILPRIVDYSASTWRKARYILGYRRTALSTGFVYAAEQMGRQGSATYAYDASLTAVRSRMWTDLSIAAKFTWIVAGAAFSAASLVALQAAALHVTPTPFILVYALGCFWLFMVVWLDDRAGVGQKIKMSLTVLPGYFIVLATILVCLLRGLHRALVVRLARN